MKNILKFKAITKEFCHKIKNFKLKKIKKLLETKNYFKKYVIWNYNKKNMKKNLMINKKKQMIIIFYLMEMLVLEK